MKMSQVILEMQKQRDGLLQFGYISPDDDPDVVLDVPYDIQAYETGAGIQSTGFDSMTGRIVLRFELGYDPENNEQCGKCGAFIPETRKDEPR
jgi:hypothetical protein